MDTPKVYESEYRFCLILWEHEPVKSKALVRLCEEQLGWKPTTTYTVMRRLADRGVLKNEKTTVSSLVSKDEIQTAEMEELMEKTFQGSVPAFVAAFTRQKNLTSRDIDQVQAMIDAYRKEAGL